MALENALLDNKYLVGQVIGRGGMGAVYSAQHVGTGRRVAIKVILPRLLDNPEAIERFRREARAAGSLRHPNVVDVTDFGVCQVAGADVAYLAMEYLEGVTLRALLESEGSLPVAQVVAIIEQVALALAAAHRCEIVHRDLKPDNIWLVPDARGGHVVRVLDFGIASLGNDDYLPVPVAGVTPAGHPSPASHIPSLEIAPQADATADTIAIDTGCTSMPATGITAGRRPTDPLTLAGTTLGTPAYMSPEQCRGDHVDARSDIYSLGVIAYEALAGHLPFTGSPGELVQKHLHEVPEPLARAARLPAAISDVVARALAKLPQERFASALTMAGSLYSAAEAPTVILRRAISLYSDEFPAFWTLSTRAALPGLALILPCVAFAPFVHHPLVLLVLAGVGPLAWGLVTFRSHAFFASLITSMRHQPLGRITSAAVVADVKTRIGIVNPVGAPGFLFRLSKFYARAEATGPPWAGDFSFLIAFLEGCPLPDVRERCRLLESSVRQRYTHIRVLLLTAIFVPLLFESSLVYSLCRLLGVRDAAFVAIAFGACAMPFNAMLVNPVFSTAIALLYFRSRQALGEDVTLTALVPAKM